MKKSLISALVLAALPLVAQQPAAPAPAPAPAPPAVRYPRVSQKAVLTQTVGLTDITISYSRPGVKGRQVWGSLVPYGQIWRTGANEATTIAFSDDVTIEGKKLAKGKYALITVPGETEWTIAFNSAADQWGAFNHDPAKDVLSVKATPVRQPFSEWLTFEFPQLTTDSAQVMIRWENVGVPFTVNTGTTEKVAAAAREAIAAAKPEDWATPYRAAAFAFENGMASDAAKWLDSSLKAKETTANLYLKARMQAKAGDKAAAVKTAELAISKATPQEKDLAGEIAKTAATWKK